MMRVQVMKVKLMCLEVVTGGYNSDNRHEIVSVEYDHHENKWTYLPDMMDGRYEHGAVSIGNKMFVIGSFLI